MITCTPQKLIFCVCNIETHENADLGTYRCLAPVHGYNIGALALRTKAGRLRATRYACINRSLYIVNIVHSQNPVILLYNSNWHKFTEKQEQHLASLFPSFTTYSLSLSLPPHPPPTPCPWQVVFITALFYLLSYSEEQYLPMKWVTDFLLQIGPGSSSSSNTSVSSPSPSGSSPPSSNTSAASPSGGSHDQHEHGPAPIENAEIFSRIIRCVHVCVCLGVCESEQAHSFMNMDVFLTQFSAGVFFMLLFEELSSTVSTHGSFTPCLAYRSPYFLQVSYIL